MKRLILLAVVLAVCTSLAGWRGRFDEQFAAATSTARLPAEYQEVEYIESSGTQYIDTGMAIINNRWTVDLVFTAKTPSVNMGVITIDESIKRCHLSIAAAGDALLSWLGTSSQVYTDYNVRSVRVFDDSLGVKFDDSEFFVSEGTRPNASIWLFARHGVGTANLYSSAKIYSSVIEPAGGGARLQDLVPAVRKSDSVAGMYDLVNGVFYTNQGTGEFIVGPPVVAP